jgi:MFS family permease
MGILRASPYVGALAMAAWLAFRPDFRRAGPALFWSVCAFAAATIVFGLSTAPWLSVLALAVAGAADNVSVVIRHVLVQMRTPNALRGRVGAVNTMFIECSNELGGFESGLVSRYFGPVASVVSGGVGTILVAALVAWKVPQLRRLRRIEPLREPDPPRPPSSVRSHSRPSPSPPRRRRGASRPPRRRSPRRPRAAPTCSRFRSSAWKGS